MEKIHQLPVQVDYVHDVDQVSNIYNKLIQLDHYKKMSPGELFLIVSKAHVLGIPPLEALNGGLYSVKGRVMMAAETMNRLIRKGGHSIQKLEGTDKICRLVGKRSDNGDQMEVSFTIEEANRAGLMSNPSWRTYPSDMLFCRALSRLGRQLFADAIHGCYIFGEITEDAVVEYDSSREKIVSVATISEEEAELLEEELEALPEYKEKILNRAGGTLLNVPKSSLETIRHHIQLKLAEKEDNEGSSIRTEIS